VLINRKGQVEYVMVGNAKQIEMPDFGRSRAATERFRGCGVFTRIFKTKLTQDDLTDLALLRLDLMSIIQVEKPPVFRNGLFRHLLPTSAHRSMRTGVLAVRVSRAKHSLTARYGFHIADHVARKRNGTRATDGASSDSKGDA
jgi:hypothetical protein